MPNISDIFTESELSAALSRWESQEHHPVSPSLLFRNIKCHASAQGNVILFEVDNSTEDAKSGTSTHERIAKAIDGVYNGVVDHHIANALEAVQPFNHYTVQTEVGVELHLLYYGTADCVIMRDGGNKAIVYDWKTGYNAEISETAQEWQLKAYGFALMDMMPEIEQVKCQAIYTDSGSRGSVIVCDRKDLAGFKSFMVDLVARCKSPDAEFAECSGEFCKYCKIKLSARCPVINKETADSALSMGLCVVDPSQLTTIESADETLKKVNMVYAQLEVIERNAKKIVEANGGSESFMVQKPYSYNRTDWKALCEEVPPPSDLVQKHTKTINVCSQVKPRSKKKG